jgi:hypothetical protein
MTSSCGEQLQTGVSVDIPVPSTRDTRFSRWGYSSRVFYFGGA